MDFGMLLRRERLRSGLNQQALAARCGVSAVYIYRLEKGGIDPPSRTMCRGLAKALRVDASLLWKHAFESRFRRWVNREGYRTISKATAEKLFKMLERELKTKAGQFNEAVSPH